MNRKKALEIIDAGNKAYASISELLKKMSQLDGTDLTEFERFGVEEVSRKLNSGKITISNFCGLLSPISPKSKS